MIMDIIKTGFLITSISLFVIIFSLFIHIIWQFFISELFYSMFRNNEELRPLIQESVDFYLEKLDIDENTIIKLNIIFPNKITSIAGFVQYEEWGMLSKYNVTIYLNHSIVSILNTTAHEMIHVKQYQSGDLRHTKGKTYWKGVDFSETKYEDRPWEKDAFKREKGLAQMFMEHKNIKKPIYNIILDYLLE